MERNNRVFISFLGTNAYLACNYALEGQAETKVGNVKYIQEALLRIIAQQQNAPDRIYIFLTEEARQRNWLQATEGEGLQASLAKLEAEGLLQGASIETPDIPAGLNTADVWEIFRKVFEKIEEGDEVYLDITHAFRSIPMLGMSILNYAKALKKIQLKAIYYGAFEALGSRQEVEKTPMEDRNAAILNLVQLSDIQDWAVATNTFIEYGNASPLTIIAAGQLRPFLQPHYPESTEKTAARSLQKLTKHLKKLTEDIQTNRGKELVHGDVFKWLQEKLAEDHSGLIPLLDPVIGRLRTKLESFDTQENALNGIAAAKWCIDHGLTQQGMTLLQETVITFLCVQAGLDYTNQKNRDIVAAALWIISKKSLDNVTVWNNTARQHQDLTRLVISKIPPQLPACFDSLTEFRNDINHAGFSKHGTAGDLKKALKQSYDKIAAIIHAYNPADYNAQPQQPAKTEAIFPNLTHHPTAQGQAEQPADENTLPPQPAKTEAIFLNLTNHPSAQWQAEQREAAAAYGRLLDLPFPAVGAGASEADIQQLADELAAKIFELHRQAAVTVHLMGEMTLCFALLQRLLKAGIPCLASTSQREVVEEGDGQKTVRFRFERFRRYAPSGEE